MCKCSNLTFRAFSITAILALKVYLALKLGGSLSQINKMVIGNLATKVKLAFEAKFDCICLNIKSSVARLLSCSTILRLSS